MYTIAVTNKYKQQLSATECLQHEWLNITPEASYGQEQTKQLECAWLRKYLARRRWKRWFNTIKAMNRMMRIGASFNVSSSNIDAAVPPPIQRNSITKPIRLSNRLQRLMRENYGGLGTG